MSPAGTLANDGDGTDSTRAATPSTTGERSPFGAIDTDPLPEGPSLVAGVDAGADRQPGAVTVSPRRDPTPVARPVVDEGAGQLTRHVVQRGETLQTISYTHYGTHHRWGEIASANGIDPLALMPGDELVIPQLRGVAASTQGTARATTTPAAGGRSYTVADGDSYFTIARDQLGDSSRWQELQRLNGIDPYDLRVGTQISLPASRPQRTTSGAATRRDIPAGARTHTVRSGEYLSDIALEHLGSATRWRTIAEANNIADPTKVRVGQVLVIPQASGATTSGTAAASRASAATGGGQTHTVASGETLQTISRQYFSTTRRWPDLVRANPGINPERLMVGQRITIPAVSNSASETTSAATRSERTDSGRSSTRGNSRLNEIPELPELPRRESSSGSSNSPFALP